MLTLNSKNGFSLIEVLIGSALMIVIAFVTSSFMVNQSRELKAFDEKISIQNVQLLLSNILSSKTFCTCLMSGSTFNYSAKKWNNFPNSIPNSYEPDCAAIGSPWLTVGSKIGNSNIKITGMQLENTTETIVNSGNFIADFKIDFDQAILIRSRKKISVPFYFMLNMSDPVASRRITMCSSIAIENSPLNFSDLCAQMNGVLDSTSSPPTCKPTYQ